MKQWIALGGLFFGVTLAAQAATWNYTDPSLWGQSYPLCKMGGYQTPINITEAQNQSLSLHDLRFYFTNTRASIQNTGHDIKVTFSTSPRNVLLINNEPYSLIQFHFHTPGETKIQGQAFPMEMHLVYEDLNHQYVVLAVMITTGHENPAVTEVLSHLGDSDVLFKAPTLQSLIPQNHGYYTFEGSLTTPPCSHHLPWYVLKQTITISAAQLQAFEAFGFHNARPVQPLMGRTIAEKQ